eukprot:1186774-Prorocentrum_minimum.AAC.3
MPPKPGSGRKPGSKGKDKGGELETDAFAHLDKYPLVPLMVIITSTTSDLRVLNLKHKSVARVPRCMLFASLLEIRLYCARALIRVVFCLLRLHAKLESHTSAVTSIAPGVRTEEETVFTAGNDKRVIIWDPNTWQNKGEFGLSNYKFGGKEEWQGPFVHRRLVRAAINCYIRLTLTVGPQSAFGKTRRSHAHAPPSPRLTQEGPVTSMVVWRHYETVPEVAAPPEPEPEPAASPKGKKPPAKKPPPPKGGEAPAEVKDVPDFIEEVITATTSVGPGCPPLNTLGPPSDPPPTSWVFTTLLPSVPDFVPLTYCTTHLEDASGILHFKSGSEAHGRLHLTVKFPRTPL